VSEVGPNQAVTVGPDQTDRANDDILREAEQGLQALGYRRTSLDASTWNDADDLHDAVAAALRFPDYYGRNFDALDDCLGDVAHGDYGWSASESTGLLVVVRGFGIFARRQPTIARDLAASFGGTTRAGLLFGHRLVWLLHVDDPDFRLDVGRQDFLPWNDREWLDAKRK
jgi:hypothetical protein